MADVDTNDIAGYGAYLKSQGVADNDIQGYTKYLADQHGVDHPEEADKSWLDKPVMGYTARGAIQGTLNALPTVGMVAGGVAGLPEGGIGAVPGAMAGGAGGEALKNLGEKYILGQDKTRSDIYAGPVQAALNSGEFEMGGKLLGQGLSAASKTAPGQYILDKTGQAASAIPKWAAQKVGKIMASVPEETTARYLENPSAINNALPREQINDQIMALKTNAQDQLAKAQEELATAKGDATDKKQAFKEALKNHNLTSMAGDVSSSIGDLKDQVVKGSNEAYKTLFKASGKVETKPLVNLLQNHIDSMTVNGIPSSSSAAQAINEIRAMQDRLQNMGTHLYMPQAKQILQGLDKDIQYSNSAGNFAPQADQALSSLRTALDQDVKTQVPAYKDKMADVSRQTRLLNAANDNFGTPEKAISNLNNIASQKGQAVHFPIIEALGKETGKDLSNPVNEFLTSQKVLSTPSLFQKMLDQTPEVQKLTSSQSAVDAAKTKADLFKGISPQNITSKTKSVGGANNYGAEATFGPIDEAHGTNFQQKIQARNDADQFSKTDQAGSRKTVLGSVVGAGVGFLAHGVPGAVEGSVIGSQAGHALDKYSGQIFKSALDKGVGASKFLGNAGDAAGNLVKTSPAVAGQTAANVLPFSKSASNEPDKGPLKWANDGFQKLKGHVSDEDRQMLESNRAKLMLDPKAQNLLVSASSFSPGSKPLDDIMKHLKARLDAK